MRFLSLFRLRGRFSLLLLLAVCAAGGMRLAGLEPEPLHLYRQRRAQLMKSVPDGVVLLFGNEVFAELEYLPFRQSNEFYYLTGWGEPNAALLLLPPGDPNGGKGREILFLPPRSKNRERWTGKKLGPGDADVRERTGFREVMTSGSLQTELVVTLKRWNKIYTLRPGGHGDQSARSAVKRIERLAPLAAIADVTSRITELRMVKSPGEIELIRTATDASIEAHFAAIEAVRPGVYEYEIAALMKYEFERRGCERPAFPPIIGSGFNSTVLHYEQNRKRMEDGDLVVMDVAGEYSGYASDITRTVPVNGRFTKRQKEIYDLVLGAQNAALEKARPGMRLGRQGPDSLYQIALDYLNREGKRRTGKPLGEYFIHGLGHHVGLSVHDPATSGSVLAPGMVITIEPGVYIPEESLGVRLEDVVLITEDGHELLTRRLPRKPDEIEKLMAKSK